VQASPPSGNGARDHHHEIVQIDPAVDDEVVGVVDAERLRVIHPPRNAGG
jgi:hypothetical protein